MFGAIMGVVVGVVGAFIIMLDLTSISTYIAYLKYNVNLSDVNPYPKTHKTETAPSFRCVSTQDIIANMPSTPENDAPACDHARPVAQNLSDHFKPTIHDKAVVRNSELAQPGLLKPRVS